MPKKTPKSKTPAKRKVERKKAEKSISQSTIKAQIKGLEEQMSATKKQHEDTSRQIFDLNQKSEKLKAGLLVLQGSITALKETLKG